MLRVPLVEVPENPIELNELPLSITAPPPAGVMPPLTPHADELEFIPDPFVIVMPNDVLAQALFGLTVICANETRKENSANTKSNNCRIADIYSALNIGGICGFAKINVLTILLL